LLSPCSAEQHNAAPQRRAIPPNLRFKISTNATLNRIRFKRFLCGGANVCNIDKNLCAVMACVGMKQSSCYSQPLTHQASERPIWFAFWAINIGLMLEIVLSLLPVGLMQTYQSVSVGYWSARSSEFMQTDLMQTLRWLRMIGDTVFALGAISFVYFALNLMWQRPDKRVATVPAAGEVVLAPQGS
jgi:hypothetical protein